MSRRQWVQAFFAKSTREQHDRPVHGAHAKSLDSFSDARGGARQGSCPMSHAASRCFNDFHAALHDHLDDCAVIYRRRDHTHGGVHAEGFICQCLILFNLSFQSFWRLSTCLKN
ncbi:MAG: hypothetical protein EBV84_12375 [Betaproteobacteria bacterium]|nr:hypothetical protein [Betaproteobacteria bacterium]